MCLNRKAEPWAVRLLRSACEKEDKEQSTKYKGVRKWLIVRGLEGDGKEMVMQGLWKTLIFTVEIQIFAGKYLRKNAL